MNKQEIIWYSFERDAIPQALNGVVDVGQNGPTSTFGAPHPKDGEIVIGFGERTNYQQRIVPILIVTNEFSAQDVFSWLSTYTPETFPLSQFARVISEKDWKEFDLKETLDCPRYEHEDSWASVILGELLSQGESDVEVASIPFSRATACFSTAIARTALIYSRHSNAFSICISRLTKIESDSRFVRRQISVSDLALLWEVLLRYKYRRDEFHDSLEAKMNGAISIVLGYLGDLEKNVGIDLKSYPGLTRNSMEERVLAFQKLVTTVNLRFGHDTDSRHNAIIAAAAFLVGRGTSHISLLRRISKTFPSAILWFGAIAAMAGPKCWDQHWSRAVRGIEKHLRPPFHWQDLSLSDLCWHEYDWLSANFSGDRVFEALSKNTPNVISVEVVPGASCQMRLASSIRQAQEQDKGTEKQDEQRNAKYQELEAWAAQVLAIATKGQELLYSNKKSNQEQGTLFKGDPVLSSKAPKKKAKGGTGFDR